MLKITSSAFSNEGNIPIKFTCRGEDVNPPLAINNVPRATKSLALFVDDPDAPMGNWNHWLVWNIDPKTNKIMENSVPAEAILGITSSGDAIYHGPCPPYGTHRYFFKVYALDTMLDISVEAKRDDFLTAMNGHILEESELMGRYGKEK